MQFSSSCTAHPSQPQSGALALVMFFISVGRGEAELSLGPATAPNLASGKGELEGAALLMQNPQGGRERAVLGLLRTPGCHWPRVCETQPNTRVDICQGAFAGAVGHREPNLTGDRAAPPQQAGVWGGSHCAATEQPQPCCPTLTWGRLRD